MYLHRLEIQGFKSFARKTVFEFAEKSGFNPGAKSITAIVGPNGSGKSNVADAIRWVLGEQSLKLIRCKKAEEVIFGGSEKKARQGFAEVSLYLNNEDRELAIEYSEVALTRRVFRDGEAEYFLNKSRVRLFDVLLLLAKANFGQKSYSLIGQGMVDHIINVSAFERKEFFDEATGVKQYQIKRDQSVNRLRRTRENLEQTNKILAELEPRLRLLTRQIKKLEKRKEIESNLRALQEKYYGHIWRGLESEKKQFEERFQLKDALKKEIEGHLAERQIELNQAAREESRRDVFNGLQKEFNRLIAEKNELLKEAAIVKGKMNVEYVKAGQQNLAWLEDKKEEIETRLAELKESFNNAQIKLSQKRQLLTENEEKISEINSQLAVLNNNLKVAEEEISAAKSEAGLDRAEESIKALLRQKDFIRGICATIGDLGAPDAKFETALAAAAGHWKQAMVVENHQSAVKAINYLKENKLAPIFFLPLNKLSVPGLRSKKPIEGAMGFAIDSIRFDVKYKRAFQFVFSGTIIVDNLENAFQLEAGGLKIVTLGGDIIEPGGALRGGVEKSSAGWSAGGLERGALAKEEKIKEIALAKLRIEEVVRAKNNFEKEGNQLLVDIQVLETKNKGLNNDWESLRKEKQRIEAEISEIKIEPKDEGRHLKNLESKRAELERWLAEQEAKIDEARRKIDAFNLEEEKKNARIFRLQGEAQQCQLKLNEINREISGVQVALARLETKAEDLGSEVKRELGEARFNATDEIINADQMWFEIGKLKKELEQIGGIDAEAAAEHQEVSARFEFLSSQIIDLEKAANDLEKVVKELDDIIDKQFFSSFKKINDSFAKYFQKIFSGGKAKLELVQKETETDRDLSVAVNGAGTVRELSQSPAVEAGESLATEEKSELQNTGIEIMVAPPNKKIANIAALSGGERTMTSLALICAIIDNNPSPFIVMDEVDAALDEANSEKFAGILQELARKSQFIVITHNRVIMHVADALYGVAMGEDGVSKTLSLKLQEQMKERPATAN
jgi:chromosome segregation protein